MIIPHGFCDWDPEWLGGTQGPLLVQHQSRCGLHACLVLDDSHPSWYTHNSCPFSSAQRPLPTSAWVSFNIAVFFPRTNDSSDPWGSRDPFYYQALEVTPSNPVSVWFRVERGCMYSLCPSAGENPGDHHRQSLVTSRLEMRHRSLSMMDGHKRMKFEKPTWTSLWALNISIAFKSLSKITPKHITFMSL